MLVFSLNAEHQEEKEKKLTSKRLIAGPQHALIDPVTTRQTILFQALAFTADLLSEVIKLVLITIPAEVPAPKATPNVAGLASPVSLLQTSLVDGRTPFLVVQIANQTLALHMVQELWVDSETAETLITASSQDSDVVGVVDVATVAADWSVFFYETSGRGASDGVTKGAKR